MVRFWQAIVKDIPQNNDNSEQCGGKQKAAKMGGSLPFHSNHYNFDGWAKTIQTYSDYFIRY